MENLFKVLHCLKTVDSLTLLHPPIISEVMKELRSPFLHCRSQSPHLSIKYIIWIYLHQKVHVAYVI